jgi:sugar lactone lactonase YvrE
MKKALWIPVVLFCVGCAGSGAGTASKPAVTLAGGAASGAADGPVASASFNNPVNVAVGPDRSIYVADFDNHRIRKISSSGVVSTLVNQAGFVRPFGLALSGDSLYIQTDGNSSGVISSANGAIWRLTLSTNTLTLLGEDLGRPRGLAVLPSGQLVTADLAQHILRIFNPATGAMIFLAGQSGTAGFADGMGGAARFNRPYGMAVMADGSILVADAANNRLRRVHLSGHVETFAGTGAAGSTDGPVASATFTDPQDVVIAPDGTIYVADTTSRKVRMIKHGVVSTIAGDGMRGFRDGDLMTSRFWGLEGLDLLPDGNLVVADGTGGEDGEPYNRVRLLRLASGSTAW